MEDELIVVGSQAVLASHPDPPALLLTSMELDRYPRTDPARADEIDRSLGDGSRFHGTFGFCAHGVGPETVTAPVGWEERLDRLELLPLRKRDGNAVAWCLSIGDLVLAKLAAGRPHDLDFAVEGFARGWSSRSSSSWESISSRRRIESWCARDSQVS